jgi:hypothetical protein
MKSNSNELYVEGWNWMKKNQLGKEKKNPN